MQDKEFDMNRLQHETSPYLLPVDWYPWGAEAFETARREDKPVFLSIGYSTCHWCHVMAHESFEDAEVAAFLNARFQLWEGAAGARAFTAFSESRGRGGRLATFPNARFQLWEGSTGGLLFPQARVFNYGRDLHDEGKREGVRGVS